MATDAVASGKCGMCGAQGLLAGSIIDVYLEDMGRTVWVDLCGSCWRNYVKIYNTSTFDRPVEV